MIGLYFLATGVICLLVLLARQRGLVYGLAAVFFGLQTAFALYAWLHQGQTEWLFFTYDPAGVILLAVLAILSWATFRHGIDYLRDEPIKKLRYYHAALIGLIASMTGAYLTNDFTAMWVFVEATTLTVAALIYHDRTPASLEATWKYIFVCSVGIAIAYFGILFLSASFQPDAVFSLAFEGMSERLSGAGTVYLRIAFICLLVGYSSKMGLFPMHTVAIDAHTVAPPPISALISTALMNVGFLAIYRGYVALSATPVYEWMNHVLLLSGTLSLFVSAAYMQKVKHMKRMFAYSSLENMGIVAIGLGIGGFGAYAAFLHLILHSFVKASLFYQGAHVHRVFHTYDMNRVGDYLRINPVGAGILLLATLGITAIPPSGLFISEWLIVRELVAQGEWFVLIPSLFFLVFVIYAFVYRIIHLVYARSEDFSLIPRQTSFSIPAILLLLLVVILCFYRPPFLDHILLSALAQLPA